MSNEAIINKKTNLLSGIGTNVAFSGIMTGGFGSLSSIKKHGGIKNAINATKHNNKVLKTYAEKIAPQNDVFTKNLKVSQNYQEYTRLAKLKAKSEKKLTKYANDLPLFEKFKNLFKKGDKKLKLSDYRANLETNIAEFSKKTSDLSAGKSITKTLDGASNILSSAKGLFKSELKDPFGIFFAGTEFFTRFTSEAIPAFKNEGFVAGLKSTGKALAAAGATWITDAGFSVVLRSAGATVGSFFGPVGTAIGSIVGNAIGGLLSCNLIQKIFPMKQKETEVAQENQENNSKTIAQENNQVQEQAQEANLQENVSQELVAQKDEPKYITTPNGSSIPFDKNMSAAEVRNLAYQQAFNGKAPTIKYYG